MVAVYRRSDINMYGWEVMVAVYRSDIEGHS